MTSYSPEHEQSRRYWAKVDNSFLDNSEYYQRAEQALVSLFPKIGHAALTVDLGCGNGRFTMPLAEISDRVIGVDIAPLLIEEAQKTAADLGMETVSFEVEALEDYQPPAQCNLIACQGVTSCLYDDEIRDQLLQRIEESLVPGGFLLLRDTLSKGEQDVIYNPDEYIGRYRTLPRYLNYFETSGKDWDLIETITLKEDPAIQNMYMLFRLGE